VCRARGAAPKIYPNIFAEPTSAKAEAQIEYLLGDIPFSHAWTEGVPGPDILAAISVFDRSCASVYVEDKTDVAFRPAGLDLFHGLVQACDRVKSSINTFISSEGSPRRFLELEGQTAVGQLIRDLGGKQATQTLERLGVLSEKELARLKEVKELVAQLNANDTTRRAVELRLLASRFALLLKHAQLAESLLTAEAVDSLREGHDRVRATAEAALLASGAAFDDEPLRGVGTEPWRELWEAARRYSEKVAYVGQPFPMTDENAACVLCQQPVLGPAASRLLRFEAFVLEDTQKAHTAATVALEELLGPVLKLAVLREADENVLEELYAFAPGLSESFKAYLGHMDRRAEELRAACASGDWNVLTTALSESPCEQLRALIASIEQSSHQLEKAGDPDGAAALRGEYEELQARERLAGLKEEVRAEIARQQRIASLRACLKDTDTTGITSKNTELTKSEVTEGLRAEFNKELRELNLQHLAVSVAAEHGAKGVMFHKIAFDEAKTKGWVVQEVLSEGEHRCIALAAFLAELSMQPIESSIILDDPVSSLDHTRREFVARRLVREAVKRQVIVLTHDLVFLLFLQEQAELQKVEFTSRFLDREKGALGVPVDGLPWYGMGIKARVAWLREQVVKLRKTFKDESMETYSRDAAFLWGRLREAWECAVEEVLLNGAIRRFGRKVSTLPLHAVCDITEADIQTVNEGMTACSSWLPGHDQAPALNTQMPDPDSFSSAVELLASWRQAIVKRREIKKAG